MEKYTEKCHPSFAPRFPHLFFKAVACNIFSVSVKKKKKKVKAEPLYFSFFFFFLVEGGEGGESISYSPLICYFDEKMLGWWRAERLITTKSWCMQEASGRSENSATKSQESQGQGHVSFVLLLSTKASHKKRLRRGCLLCQENFHWDLRSFCLKIILRIVKNNLQQDNA